VQPLGEAAKLSDKGDLYMQLAQLHMADENWKKAAAAVDAALNKDDLTDKANAQLLLGIIYYSAKNKAAARRAFEKAATYEKTRKPARQWLRSLRTR
jgi:tetratricopeptide (TPR) repeat protein